MICCTILYKDGTVSKIFHFFYSKPDSAGKQASSKGKEYSWPIMITAKDIAQERFQISPLMKKELQPTIIVFEMELSIQFEERQSIKAVSIERVLDDLFGRGLQSLSQALQLLINFLLYYLIKMGEKICKIFTGRQEDSAGSHQQIRASHNKDEPPNNSSQHKISNYPTNTNQRTSANYPNPASYSRYPNPTPTNQPRYSNSANNIDYPNSVSYPKYPNLSAVNQPKFPDSVNVYNYPNSTKNANYPNSTNIINRPNSPYSASYANSSSEGLIKRFGCDEKKAQDKQSLPSQIAPASGRAPSATHVTNYKRQYNKKTQKYEQDSNSYRPTYSTTPNSPPKVRKTHQQKSINENLPPKPAYPPYSGCVGQWASRWEFKSQRKSFGYFYCSSCRKQWISAHAFKEYKQGCKSCHEKSYPAYIWFNELGNYDKQRNESLEKGMPHMSKLCEACKAGVCIRRYQ